MSIEKEIYLKKSQIPVYRRMSGGGSVYHGRGNLNYGCVVSLSDFPELYPVHNSFKLILDQMRIAFSKNGIRLAQKGISDLSIFQGGNWRKISGTAQVRKKGWLLFHGSFLTTTDLNQPIQSLLRFPPKSPEYRKNRTHRDFLIRTALPQTSSEIRKILTAGFSNLINPTQIKKNHPQNFPFIESYKKETYF